jgi:intracellular septation protein A
VSRPAPAPPTTVRAVGYSAAAWCLLPPSAAWTAAGGVTVRAVLYVLFFLAGAALFGVLAVWFHRRHHLRWTSAVAGLAGAPLLLGLLLAVAPAVLGQWGLLPT